MTEQEILKAFEGRWRIKAEAHPQAWVKGVKELCLDFFRTGILLAEGSVCCDSIATTSQSTIPMSAIMKAAEEISFSTWWDMYGKKIDRAKCERKWNKLTLAEKEACLAATPAYVASTPDLQYRRHPATYLNNRSWENQIIYRNNGESKPILDQQRIDKLAAILTP